MLSARPRYSRTRTERPRRPAWYRQAREKARLEHQVIAERNARLDALEQRCAALESGRATDGQPRASVMTHRIAELESQRALDLERI